MYALTVILLLLTICSNSVLCEQYIIPLFGLNNTDDSANTEFKLIVTSSVSSVITVSGTSSNSSIQSSTTTTTAGNINTISVVGLEFLNSSTIGNDSLLVDSTENVTLQVFTKNAGYNEGFMAIPVSDLGNEYYVSTFCALGGFCQITIATTVIGSTDVYLRLPNNTYEEIVFCMTTKLWKSGRDNVISLEYPETIQITSPRDLTGSYIYTDNPVSVLVGAHSIPDKTSTSMYHYIEQLVPTREWGKEFMLKTRSTGFYGDVLTITARQDNTRVSISGSQDTTLSVGQYINHRVQPDGITNIVSSHPIQVILLEGIEFEAISSTTSRLVIQDPGMSLLPAIQHMHSVSTFGCPHSTGSVPSFQMTSLATTPSLFPPLSVVSTYNVPFTEYKLDTAQNSDSTSHMFAYQSVGIVRCDETAIMPFTKLVLPTQPCTLDYDGMFPGDGIDGDCGGIVDDDRCYENKMVNATFHTTDGLLEPHFENISGFRYVKLRIQSICDTPNIYLTTENNRTLFIRISEGTISIHSLLLDNSPVHYQQNLSQYTFDCDRIYPFWLVQASEKVCFDFGPIPSTDCSGTSLTINTPEVIVGMRLGGSYTNVTYWIDLMKYDCAKLHSAWRCGDFISNCIDYGPDVCTSHADWAEAYCGQYCGTCSPDSYGQSFILTLPSTLNNDSFKYISVFSKNLTQNSSLSLIGIGLTSKNYQVNSPLYRLSYMQTETGEILTYQAFGIKGETDTNTVIHLYANEDVRVTVNYHMKGFDYPRLNYAVEPVDISGAEYMTSFIHSSITCHILSNEGATRVWKLTRDAETDIGIVTANETMIVGLTGTETSGTVFSSTKPFTIFCGNTDTNFTWQQLRPTSTWGKTYIVPPVYDPDVVEVAIRVITNSDSTVVLLSGNFDIEFLLPTRGKFFDQVIDQSQVYNITANRPVSVSVLYRSANASLQDSSWISLPPTINFINNTELYIPSPENDYTSVYMSAVNDNLTSSDDSFNLSGYPNNNGVYHTVDLHDTLVVGRTAESVAAYMVSSSTFNDLKETYSCQVSGSQDINDGIDNDCDALVDEENVCYTGYGAERFDGDLDGWFSDDCLAVETGTPILTSPSNPVCIVNVSTYGCWMACDNCKCSWVNNLNTYNDMTEQQQIAYNENITEVLIKILTVNKESLSSERLKLESAQDDRTSTQSMGYVGFLVLAFACLIFVFFDVVSLFTYLRSNIITGTE